MPREALLAQTLVELADQLVDDFDLVELLGLVTDRCVDIVDASAAGIMLAGPDGNLRPMVASSETMRLLELFEAQASEGPCFDCYTTALPVANADLTAETPWPGFSPRAVEAGFHSATALPMRRRGATIGALNLFTADTGRLDPSDLAAAQALADVATIAIMQHRIALESQLLNEQLQEALNSRIVLEQAKGMVAERHQLDMERAFDRLQSYGRANRIGISKLAAALTTGSLSLDVL